MLLHLRLFYLYFAELFQYNLILDILIYIRYFKHKQQLIPEFVFAILKVSVSFPN